MYISKTQEHFLMYSQYRYQLDKQINNNSSELFNAITALFIFGMPQVVPMLSFL